MINKEKFDWREYKMLADEHIATENEAMKRTCVSRYYYSSFCSARNFIRKRKTYLNFESKRIFDYKSVKSHKEVQKILKYHEKYGSYGKKISKKLNKLRKWRNQCDYDDSIVEDLDYILIKSNEFTSDILDFLNRFN